MYYIDYFKFTFNNNWNAKGCKLTMELGLEAGNNIFMNGIVQCSETIFFACRSFVSVKQEHLPLTDGIPN